jgi:hypothetical protein
MRVLLGEKIVGKKTHKPFQLKLLFFFIGLAFLCIPRAEAQIQVDISIKRPLYIAYEPLIVNVSISNLTGEALELVDSGKNLWFGFQIENLDGRPIPANESEHINPPVRLEPGQKLTRAINITPLYPIGEFGGYRIRASIYAASLNKWFNSDSLNVEITEGRSIYEKTIGVPQSETSAGSLRKITLLTHRLPSSSQLYLRVQDPSSGIIYCTHRLGRIVSYGTPEIRIDGKNTIHVFQNVAPKVFLYSHIGLNGEIFERAIYNQSGRAKPVSQLKPDGTIAILGATISNNETAGAAQETPNLSDRPVPLPAPSSKSKLDDARPKNLLSK